MKLQVRHREGQPEAAWAGTARVEVEHAAALLDSGFVRVTGDYDTDAGALGVQVDVRERVQHIDPDAAEFEQLRSGQSGAGSAAIDIATDRRHRGKLSEGFENGGVAHVACVQDVFGAGQGGEGFGPKQAVGIGDHTDEHG